MADKRCMRCRKVMTDEELEQMQYCMCAVCETEYLQALWGGDE